MNRRLRLLVGIAGWLPHPDPPPGLYLRLLRAEPRPRRLVSRLSGVPRQVDVSDQTIPLEHGPAGVRVYRPGVSDPARTGSVADRPSLPLVLNFHGGGFVFGNLTQTDWLCARVAAGVPSVVVSVRYRLAPEHPAPIPYRDCWAASRWLLDHADRFGADPAHASVMGPSAGGTLAALVALAHRDRCRREPGRAPLRQQVLLYPATDLTLSSPSVAEHGRAPILTRRIMDWYGRQYLPQGRPDSVAFDDPWVSPLFQQDLSGCAPALIIGAGQDPLRDDATRYGEALDRAGVPNRVIIFPDAVHGFISMPYLAPEAERAVTEIIDALRQA